MPTCFFELSGLMHCSPPDSFSVATRLLLVLQEVHQEEDIGLLYMKPFIFSDFLCIVMLSLVLDT
jgi:hypothetical protein